MINIQDISAKYRPPIYFLRFFMTRRTFMAYFERFKKSHVIYREGYIPLVKSFKVVWHKSLSHQKKNKENIKAVSFG